MAVNKEKLEEVMLELGHTEASRGTEYLRMACDIYDREMAMCKELYPTLAKVAGSTSSRVERAMRHSIESAWLRGNPSMQHEVFGHSIDPARGKPTVKEYLGRMTRYCSAD
jgi:two-component system response regulator (stage 0 sporulation protein A)